MQQITEQVSELMQKEMDRKDFLKHVGVGLIAVSGVGSLLKSLNAVSSHPQPRTGTYGYANFGGSPRKN